MGWPMNHARSYSESMEVTVHAGTLHNGIVYPWSDGEPMADNTLQWDWIAVLKGNIDVLVEDFVAGDLLWYPVEGRPDIRRAPDVLVALGRPKGHRGSYMQFLEDDVVPQIVIEVLSPKNTKKEMRDKRIFYDLYGVDEYYVIDPDRHRLTVWIRDGDALQSVDYGESFTSPLLGIRFVQRDGEVLEVFHPDGEPFRSFAEEHERTKELEARAAEQEARAAEQEARAARMAERLRALGVDPDAL